MAIVEEKHALAEVLEQIGHDCFAYSGRAMYGAKCLAVSGKLAEIMADIFGACLHSDIPEDSKEEIEAALREMKLDALGRDEVIYFPSVAFTEEPAKAGYEARGRDRGCCGHQHETLAEAWDCCKADWAAAEKEGERSDRNVQRCDRKELNAAEEAQLTRYEEAL